MKNQIYKNFFWVVSILLTFTLLLSLAYELQQPIKEVNLSDLANKINAGEVQGIVVSGNDLSISLKDGEKLTSKKEDGVGITETLKNYSIASDKMSAISLEIREQSGLSFWLSIIIPAVLPLLIIGVLFWLFTRQAKGGINQAFSFGKANLKPFAGFRDKITFADVAGLKEAKEELREIVDFLKTPKKYIDMGAKIPRGVLLMGSPGTGKTLLARAVAGEAGVPFFHISASEFVEMFVGVGASRTRDAFATAKRAAPSILFIDEIDAVGRERGTGMGGGHDEREQTLNQILVEMDGFEKETRLIVLAATNRPDVLDPALLRPGRFDRRVTLDLPDIIEREEIVKIHSKGKPLDKNVDLKRFAARTPGFSGADLANVMNEAAILAAKEGRKTILQDDFYKSIEKVMMGPERRSRVISDKEKEKVAYHEAGHAVTAAALKDSDPVHKISIVSRGRMGGYTLKLPLDEDRLKTKSQFMADLAVMMGGYASEKIFFGDISTGASNDLKEATSLARALVTRFGMSDLGPITFGRGEEMVFLGREMTTERNYSENVASKIDDEVKKFIDTGYKRAIKILTTYKAAVKKVSEELIKKEALEQEEFYALIKEF
ncbi:MAG: ATP-dependent zinc metalloprotease FtsH, partial [Patescibacteria group bacterium]